MKKLLKIGGVVLVVLVLAAGIFYAGFDVGARERGILITDSKEILDVDMSLFWEAIDTIKQKYVDSGSLKDEDLLYGAVKGVTESLGDPYSVFLPPADAKKFAEDINGSFGGVGAEIGMRNSQLLIIAPLKGNPAEKVGLKAGDKILKIDDTFTADMAVDAAVKLIRGEPGTSVTFLIMRDGWKEAREFVITRAVIVVPTLEFKMETDRIAHISLYSFNANAPRLFGEAVGTALSHGAKGFVLDLRNDPGGYLEVATNIAGWFMNRGDVVVIERFRSGEENKLRSDGNAALARMPVVVLVNGGSASAAEILAGALRDNRKAKLVGEKTFGKGSVQEVINLKDNSSLKVSIAEWLTPNGTQINKKGLEPDIVVALPEEKEGAEPSKIDVQLEKAIEVLKAELE
ncbi:MAG: S41 family peptidase [bacterium]|nr:S41 family peptidase [bacterium]